MVSLEGPLGAGKTTLSQAIAAGLGVDEPLTSPTYALIQEYEGRCPVFHMDLYRLHGPEDFENLGGPDYLGGPGVCLIEWSDRIAPYLAEVPQLWRLRLELKTRGRRLWVSPPPGQELLWPA